MKINKSDYGNIFLWGSGGLIAGVCYQLGIICFDKKFNSNKLLPETEVLVYDTELYNLFCSLHSHKHIQIKNFEAAVEYADRLVFIRYQLQQGNIQPCLTDRTKAFVDFKQCTSNLDDFFIHSQKLANSRITVEVHNIYKRIFSILEDHWTNVLKLTQDVDK